MVNPINDANGFKHLDAGINVKNRKPAVNEKTADNESTKIEDSSISISDVSRQLTVLKDLITAAEDDDTAARVHSIRTLIENGLYHVSSQTIAKKMVNYS